MLNSAVLCDYAVAIVAVDLSSFLKLKGMAQSQTNMAIFFQQSLNEIL